MCARRVSESERMCARMWEREGWDAWERERWCTFGRESTEIAVTAAAPAPRPLPNYYLPVLLNRLIVEREKKWYWSMIIYVIIRPRCYRKTVFNKNFIWTNGIGAHFQPSELPPRNTQGARPEINGSIAADKSLRVETVRGKFVSPVFIVTLRFARRTESRQTERRRILLQRRAACQRLRRIFKKYVLEIASVKCDLLWSLSSFLL